jgi:ABC-type microcin C transport system permease subunit YejE
MFKTLEAKWNARTPVYLHNGTKENIIFQLLLVVLLFIGFEVKDKWDKRHHRGLYDYLDYPQND